MREFYVNKHSCNKCGNCFEVARENFFQGRKSYYIDKQPSSEEELNECEQAMDECPTSAIGIEKRRK